MREFSVDLATRLRTPPWETQEQAEKKAEDLLDVLLDDPRAMGPVTWVNVDPPVLGARFNVQAADDIQALEEGRTILEDALRAIGIDEPLDLVEGSWEEVHPEQAAAEAPV